MAENPYVNKVVVNDNTILDLTSDTVDAEHLAEGYTAHDLTGAQIVGTMSGGGSSLEHILDGAAEGSVRTSGSQEEQWYTMGRNAFAEGQGTRAVGQNSHAEGQGTRAMQNNQHVSGQYNVPDNCTSFYSQKSWNYFPSMFPMVVGNGPYDGDYSRSNALAVDWDGNLYLKGKIYENCTDYTTNSSGLNTANCGGTAAAGGGIQYLKDGDAWGSLRSATTSTTQYMGRGAFALGQNTKSEGECSYAEGYVTQATQPYQHVQGKYNEIDMTSSGIFAYIVGNGDYQKRSNASALDWSGNLYIRGKIYQDCTDFSTDASGLITANCGGTPVGGGGQNDLRIEFSNGVGDKTYTVISNAINNGTPITLFGEVAPTSTSSTLMEFNTSNVYRASSTSSIKFTLLQNGIIASGITAITISVTSSNTWSVSYVKLQQEQ